MKLHSNMKNIKIFDGVCLRIKIKFLNNVLFICLINITFNSVYGIFTDSNKNCTSEQFTCHSGNGECVALNWLCDDNPDCADGSDETDCNGTCRSDEFTCINKHCIQQHWICDYDDDCGDRSDEKNCEPISCAPNSEFACSKNDCITSRWRCDGDFDCPDRSDEFNCKNRLENEHFSHCLDHEFNCDDQITCIHQSWLCDGDEDCPDGADELLDMCENITCRADQFQCIDHSCISGHLFCDGKVDCNDGTDEKNCSTISQNCDLYKEFECSKGSCVSFDVLCNKVPDCIGWEDENTELCGVNECSKNNGTCSHICIDLPIGYKCDCNPGYKLTNNQTCIDVNECLEPGRCSQLCFNEKGSFKCSCSIGYLIDPRNITRCKAAEGHASLLFARRHDIRKVALDRKEITSLVNDTKMATAIDFVFRTGMIFWSDISEKKIYKAPIDEGNDRISIIEKDLTISDGLAIDWIYNHIYWTDAKRNAIELANFDGYMRKTLVTDRVQEPRAIALNPLEGWMFWTDWGDNARIEKAGMDGTHRMVIIGNDIKWPNGLTLDLLGSRVYWVDAKLNIIGSCNYDGSNRRTVLYSVDSLKHPFSITMFEDYVYWTDWNKKTIFKANKFNGQELEAITSLKSLHYPMVVHVYHPYKQPDGVNQCQSVNGHCSHLCLPSPKINSRSPLLSCACPDDLILLPDGLMCVENGYVTSRVNRSLIDESHDVGLIAGFVISIACLILLFIVFIGSLCYKHYQYNITSMNFDNPVYRKTTEDQFSLEKSRLTFSTSVSEEVLVCAIRSPK